MRHIYVTRSSAQGNCSAKCLAGNDADSSLSSLSSVGFQGRGPGRGRGRGLGKGVKGAGDISSTLPYTALPHGASP